MWSISHIITYTIFCATLIRTCCCQKKITTAFTDPVTGIRFQRFFGAKTSFGFGIALSPAPNDSFIGQLTFPLINGAGWGGWSLTGDMEGPLLMAAWSDGTKVISSFRQAANENDNPPEVTGNFRARPIAAGTSVNSSFLTFTFLCEGCLNAALGLDGATSGKVKMGWALGSKQVSHSASSAATLNFHDVGFGGFRAQLAQAKNAKFDVWAAMAGAPSAPASGATPFKPKSSDNDDEVNDSDSEDNYSDNDD